MLPLRQDRPDERRAVRTVRRPAVALLLGALTAGCSADGPSAPPSAGASASASAGAPAAGSPNAGPTTSAPVTTSAPPTSAGRLTGDGIDLPLGVVVFGLPVAQALPALEAALGRPTTDTGEQRSSGTYGTCPGTRLRALEYGGGALVVLFGDVDGADLTMYSWTLGGRGSAQGLPRASALVGDVATFEFGVGTTLAALREGAGEDAVVVRPPDEVRTASFEVRDQSSGLTGDLTGPSPQDTVTSVRAGTPCGE